MRDIVSLIYFFGRRMVPGDGLGFGKGLGLGLCVREAGRAFDASQKGRDCRSD